jgi:hypothetical protein
VIEWFWYSTVPRAWGCETALAGVGLGARWFYRAYLALHPHASLCFFFGFPGFDRFLIEFEDFW